MKIDLSIFMFCKAESEGRDKSKELSAAMASVQVLWVFPKVASKKS